MSKPWEERGNVTNTVNGDISDSTIIQGRNVSVVFSEAHQVDWPIRVGAIPEAAAHYQHRAVTHQLEKALHNPGTAVKRQILSGTGGVGKTQLAAHYARTLARITDLDQRVDVLVWANANSREQITFAYSQAARHLFATVPDDPEKATQLFLTWLQNPTQHRNRRWLVIWDNLTDPGRVRDLWPPHDQTNGRVLVTTRRRDNSLRAHLKSPAKWPCAWHDHVL